MQKKLYQYYSRNILLSPIDIFVASGMGKKNVIDTVNTFFDIENEHTNDISNYGNSNRYLGNKRISKKS